MNITQQFTTGGNASRERLAGGNSGAGKRIQASGAIKERRDRTLSSNKLGGVDPRLPTTDHSSKEHDSRYAASGHRGVRSKQMHRTPSASGGNMPTTGKKKDPASSAIDYDKVRYPGYKELVCRKNKMDYLPAYANKITRMLNLGGPLDMGGRINALEPNATGGIRFDSDFECGNIDQVRMRSPTEFDLWIRNDTNGQSNL